MENESIEVRHNASASRFEAVLGAESAVLDYLLDGGVMRITHTFVPPSFRGRGIAEKLAYAAMEHAKAQGYKVEPLCSYAVVYLQRHTEYQSLVD